jgi:hypothetical protein
MGGAARAVLLDLLSSLCGDPAVAESGRPVDGCGCGGTDPHVNGFGRQWTAAGGPQWHRFFRGDLLAGEQTPEHRQGRLEPCDTAAQWDPHTAELLFTTSKGALQDETPRSQRGEAAHLFDQPHLVPSQGQQEERAGRPLPPTRPTTGQASARSGNTCPRSRGVHPGTRSPVPPRVRPWPARPSTLRQCARRTRRRRCVRIPRCALNESALSQYPVLAPSTDHGQAAAEHRLWGDGPQRAAIDG